MTIKAVSRVAPPTPGMSPPRARSEPFENSTTQKLVTARSTPSIRAILTRIRKPAVVFITRLRADLGREGKGHQLQAVEVAAAALATENDEARVTGTKIEVSSRIALDSMLVDHWSLMVHEETRGDDAKLSPRLATAVTMTTVILTVKEVMSKGRRGEGEAVGALGVVGRDSRRTAGIVSTVLDTPVVLLAFRSKSWLTSDGSRRWCSPSLMRHVLKPGPWAQSRPSSLYSGEIMLCIATNYRPHVVEEVLPTLLFALRVGCDIPGLSTF